MTSQLTIKPMTWRDKAEHLAIALAVQGAIGAALALAGVANGWWIGAAAAIGIFAGREERDDENRHLREPGYPNWRNALVWRWSADGMLDLAVPAVAVVALALLLG